MSNNTFTFIDLFSGIGGFRIACESLGGKCIGFSEIDSKAISVYKDNFVTDDELEIGDITKAKESTYADILLGGVPCQSWSIAGRMKGFEDPRGKLWLDTINYTKQAQPQAFVYENVKGLADPRNKSNLDLIISEFDNLGYNLYYQVLNAFDFGLPQSRERVFIVGIRKDLDNHTFEFPEKHKSLPFLLDILDGGIKTTHEVANHIDYKNSFNIAAIANKGNFYIFSDVRNGDHTIHSWDLIETSPKEKKICLFMLKNRRKPLYGSQDGNPMSHKDIANLFSSLTFESIDNNDYIIEQSDLENLVEKKILRKMYRQITVKEASRLQGFPNSYIFNTKYSTSMGLLGNAVAVNVVKLVVA